jgi:hypothetical protein
MQVDSRLNALPGGFLGKGGDFQLVIPIPVLENNVSLEW